MGFFICSFRIVWFSTTARELFFCYSAGNKSKDVKIIKQISKSEIEKLLSEGVIRNTRRGYVDRRGEHIGYYKTCGGKRYIEDKYIK